MAFHKLCKDITVEEALQTFKYGWEEPLAILDNGVRVPKESVMHRLLGCVEVSHGDVFYHLRKEN